MQVRNGGIQSVGQAHPHNDGYATVNPRNIIYKPFPCNATMINTYPDGEAPFPEQLGVPGQRLWHWVELAFYAPFFIIEVVVDTEDGAFVRPIVTADIRMVANLDVPGYLHARLHQVFLLSPGYLNGTEEFHLARLAEIWSASDDHFGDVLFVLDDGRTMRHSMIDPPADLEAMRQIVDLRQLDKPKTRSPQS